MTLGLGSLIGSGWLFGAWEASKIAGPAAILSWIIGGLIIGIIAFNYIELGTMFPESGSMSKFAQYTHGSLVGFIASWANWISLITLIPIEAVAAVQYMASWPWSWANWTRSLFKSGVITPKGLLVVTFFIVVFTLLNYWSVSILTTFTSWISLFKIGVPIITIVTLVASGFYPSNLGTSMHEFLPYGTASVFSAVSASGIIFSFNAFQTVINMGNEVENPGKNIGLGIFLSLAISGILYVLLQVTYVTTIPSSLIMEYGWKGINFTSPFADIAILVGLHWLSTLLYVDAFVSPFGTGVSFVASTGRALSAMATNEHLPKFIGNKNPKYGIPRNAFIVNSILSIAMVSIFRSWGTLASVISTATLIAYLTGPVSVTSLRKMAPNLKRPVRLKALKLMAPLSFVLASLAVYWAKWPTTFEVVLIILLGLPVYIFYEWRLGWYNTIRQIKSSYWLLAYLLFLTVISYLGGSQFNGRNMIPYPWDFLVVTIFSLWFYYWGTGSWTFTPSFKRAKRVNDKAND